MYGGLSEGAGNSIVTLNKGARDGLEEGHVLAIYREGELIKNPKYIPSKEDANKPKLPELNRDDFDISKGPDGKMIVNKAKEKSKEMMSNNEIDPKQIKLPDERVGLVMVFRVFNKVSYGLVVQSEEPINVLDIVQTP